MLEFNKALVLTADIIRICLLCVRACICVCVRERESVCVRARVRERERVSNRCQKVEFNLEFCFALHMNQLKMFKIIIDLNEVYISRVCLYFLHMMNHSGEI